MLIIGYTFFFQFLCWNSDRKLERGYHIVCSLFLGVIGYIFLLSSLNIGLRYTGAVLVACAIYPSIPLVSSGCQVVPGRNQAWFLLTRWWWSDSSSQHHRLCLGSVTSKLLERDKILRRNTRQLITFFYSNLGHTKRAVGVAMTSMIAQV